MEIQSRAAGWPGEFCLRICRVNIELMGDFRCRKSAFLSLALALLTVSLFVYILLLPLIKGEQPNVRPPQLARFDRRSGVILSRKISGFWNSIVRGGSPVHCPR